MNPSIIRFHHFTSAESYCKLQEIFGSFDYKHNYDSIEKPLKDFEITYYAIDEFTQKDTYDTLSFRKDFLLPGIGKLKNHYFENFKKSTYDKGVFSQELLDGFSKYHRQNLLEIRNEIMCMELIDMKIRATVAVQIDRLIDLIDDFISNPYSHIKDRIQFNWNRTDVQYFFYLLRENKVVSWIEDADLGRIIDAICQYHDGNEYLGITNSRKHLNDYKNSTSKPVQKATERLQDVFKADFFNV